MANLSISLTLNKFVNTINPSNGILKTITTLTRIRKSGTVCERFFEWSEPMMDQILIKDLLVRGVIGVNERERTQTQDILINVVLFTDTQKGAQTDRIEDCIDYRTVTKKILAYTEKAQRYTVEALAGDIAKICLEDASIQGARVRVEKPGAVRFTRSVGVEIERYQPK
jgi:FolB domain-containing protein